MADTTVLGLFEDIPQAADALTRLQHDNKQTPRDLMVLSSVPFPEGVLEADKSPIRLPMLTFVGALLGIGAGLLLSLWTPSLYLIPTGGKPVLSYPAAGIIAFENMMLLALLFAFVGALFEVRLPDWRAKVYDPRIQEGLIGIAARCDTDDEARAAEEIIKGAGAVDVRRDARSFE